MDPWERFQNQPAAEGPWTKFAPVEEPGLVRRILNAGNDVVDWANTRAGNVVGGLLDFFPTTAGIAGGDLSKPPPKPSETVKGALKEIGFKEVNLPGRGGKIADAAAEGVLGGIPFGAFTIGPMLANAAGGALGESLGQLTEGSKWEPYARVGGNVGGTLLASLPMMLRPTAGAMIGRRTADMTPADWASAKALQAESNVPGRAPLMAHEAMSPTQAAPVAQLFGDVASSPAGGQVRKFAADRAAPGGPIAQYINREAGNVAPPVADPKAVDTALAKAADLAVKEPQVARAAAARPFFDAARPTPVDPQLKTDTLAALSQARAAANPEGAVGQQLEKLGKQIEAAATVGHMDEAFKNFEAIAKAQAFNGEPVSDAVREALKPILQNMRAGLSATDKNYAAGMNVYRNSPQTQAVNEAQQSGVGQIAGAYQGKPDAARGLFGKWIMEPDNARPATVKADIARLNKQDPEAAKAALRLFVENHADEAFKRLQGGPNVNAGTKFTQGVAGTPNQRANLMAAVEGVTGNQTTATGFGKLIDILERTGVTPGIGSPTAGRGMTAVEAASGGILGTALESANLMRGGPINPALKWTRDMYLRKTYGDLAALTTDPKGVQKLHELALLNPESAKARALAQSLVQGITGAGRTTP